MSTSEQFPVADGWSFNVRDNVAASHLSPLIAAGVVVFAQPGDVSVEVDVSTVIRPFNCESVLANALAAAAHKS